MQQEQRDKCVLTGSDGMNRCFWCGTDAEYVRYHDEEWGRPVMDDTRIFEKLCLEGFQAGLSWLTILRKRPAFRTAFAGFDFHQVARFNNQKVGKLLQDPGIVRHRGKIDSVINNAARAIEIVKESGSLAQFIWSFAPRDQSVLESKADIRATTQESTAMSVALRKRGWSFIGPTTCYAFMQSIGMVNDHFIQCSLYQSIETERRAFLDSFVGA